MLFRQFQVFLAHLFFLIGKVTLADPPPLLLEFSINFILFFLSLPLGKYLRLSQATTLDYLWQLSYPILGNYLRLSLKTILDYLRQPPQTILDNYPRHNYTTILGNYPSLSQATTIDYLRQLSQTILDNYHTLSGNNLRPCNLSNIT